MAEKEPSWAEQRFHTFEILFSFQSMAEKEPGVKFVGRLASYKYFNMDQVNIKMYYSIF